MATTCGEEQGRNIAVMNEPEPLSFVDLLLEGFFALKKTTISYKYARCHKKIYWNIEKTWPLDNSAPLPRSFRLGVSLLKYGKLGRPWCEKKQSVWGLYYRFFAIWGSDMSRSNSTRPHRNRSSSNTVVTFLSRKPQQWNKYKCVPRFPLWSGDFNERRIAAPLAVCPRFPCTIVLI